MTSFEYISHLIGHGMLAACFYTDTVIHDLCILVPCAIAANEYALSGQRNRRFSPLHELMIAPAIRCSTGLGAGCTQIGRAHV